MIRALVFPTWAAANKRRSLNALVTSCVILYLEGFNGQSIFSMSLPSPPKQKFPIEAAARELNGFVWQPVNLYDFFMFF